MSDKKRPVTYTVLILDQSGSMEDRRAAAVAAYNEQVQQAKLNSVDQDIYCGLLTFNAEVFEHLWNVPAADLKQSTDDNYRCEGGTALNDALGYAIQKLLDTTPKDDPNVSYLIQVITDGDENSSRHFGDIGHDGKRNDGAKRLRQLASGVQETNRWTISFIGCDAAYLQKLATEMAIPASGMAAMNFAQNAANGMAASAVNAGIVYRARHQGYTGGDVLRAHNLGPAGAVGPMGPRGPEGMANYSSTTDADLLCAKDAILNEIKTSGSSVLLAGIQANLAAQPKVDCFANHTPVSWSVAPQTVSTGN